MKVKLLKKLRANCEVLRFKANTPHDTHTVIVRKDLTKSTKVSEIRLSQYSTLSDVWVIAIYELGLCSYSVLSGFQKTRSKRERAKDCRKLLNRSDESNTNDNNNF